ncbi:MAG: hypothetical protein ACLRP4_07660, partial [Dialister invisus]
FPLGVIRNISKGFAVVVRETLNVILNECEGSIPVVRKAVRRHQSHRFFTPCHIAAFPSFPQSILASIQNDDFGKARH